MVNRSISAPPARRKYSAVPTRAAASAPNAWESAVRWGTAVMGIRAMGTPMTVPHHESDGDPRVADDPGVEQGAADGERHAEDAREDPPPGGGDRAQPVEGEDEANGGQNIDDLDPGLGAHHLPRLPFLNMDNMR